MGCRVGENFIDPTGGNGFRVLQDNIGAMKHVLGKKCLGCVPRVRECMWGEPSTSRCRCYCKEHVTMGAHPMRCSPP